MNRNIRAAVITLLLCWHSIAAAQSAEPKFSRTDSPCGDPAVHSDFYLTPDEFEKAVVTNVENGNTVVVTLAGGKRRRLRLGGVEVPDVKTAEGQSSRRYLSGLVLNKRVEVWFYSDDFTGEAGGVRLAVKGVSPEVNLSMLESGMGRYGAAEHVGAYARCVYRLAAKKAEEEGKGLWKRRSAP